MDFDLLYSLPSVLSTWGGQYPASLLMLVVVTVVLLLFKKKLQAPRPSEDPPVKNVNLSHITACKESGPWSHRKIIST